MKWLAAMLFVTAPVFAQTRIASDFEIAQMKQQIATSRDFLSQLSGHLNLGDLYLTRSETATARSEYEKALEIAGNEALAARKASDITRYATAVMYSALANAKLGKGERAFTDAEEAIRYTSGSAKSWNLYASAMTELHKPGKAANAAARAITIASKDVAAAPTLANRLDLAVYQYAFASSLAEWNGGATQAEALLRKLTVALRSEDFAPLRRDIARDESFEIYSSARGDAATYLSLLNRASLRLANLLEERGDKAAAFAEYLRVLETRSDDATALAALARLSTGPERDRYYAAAFDANPFSMTLIRLYQEHLRAFGSKPSADQSTTGARVRSAVNALQHGEMRAARIELDALLRDFPNSDTLLKLRSEAEPGAQVPAFLNETHDSVVLTRTDLLHLIDLLQADKLTPEQRARLDQLTFHDTVVFDNVTTSNGRTIARSGTTNGVRFLFTEPTSFAGTFTDHAFLTFRILGATEIDGADGLLFEPIKLEPPWQF